MNKKYPGSLLLTAVLFVYFSSFLLLLTLDNFALSQKFMMNNRDFYTAKIINSMFLAEVKQHRTSLNETGIVYYRQGQLEYAYKKQMLQIKVTLKDRPLPFQHTETIKTKAKE